MHALLRPLFAFFLHIGGFGLVILGVLDSSFFFLPFGNDLLLVVLVARHHGYLPLYVLAASLGSATGVLLLDLVCREGGEEGLKKMVSARRINYLKKKMSQSAAVPLIVACVAPLRFHSPLSSPPRALSSTRRCDCWPMSSAPAPFGSLSSGLYH